MASPKGTHSAEGHSRVATGVFLILLLAGHEVHSARTAINTHTSMMQDHEVIEVGEDDFVGADTVHEAVRDPLKNTWKALTKQAKKGDCAGNSKENLNDAFNGLGSEGQSATDKMLRAYRFPKVMGRFSACAWAPELFASFKASSSALIDKLKSRYDSAREFAKVRGTAPLNFDAFKKKVQATSASATSAADSMETAFNSALGALMGSKEADVKAVDAEHSDHAHDHVDDTAVVDSGADDSDTHMDTLTDVKWCYRDSKRTGNVNGCDEKEHDCFGFTSSTYDSESAANEKCGPADHCKDDTEVDLSEVKLKKASSGFSLGSDKHWGICAPKQKTQEYITNLVHSVDQVEQDSGIDKDHSSLVEGNSSTYITNLVHSADHVEQDSGIDKDLAHSSLSAIPPPDLTRAPTPAPTPSTLSKIGGWVGKGFRKFLLAVPQIISLLGLLATLLVTEVVNIVGSVAAVAIDTVTKGLLEWKLGKVFRWVVFLVLCIVGSVIHVGLKVADKVFNWILKKFFGYKKQFDVSGSNEKGHNICKLVKDPSGSVLHGSPDEKKK